MRIQSVARCFVGHSWIFFGAVTFTAGVASAEPGAPTDVAPVSEAIPDVAPSAAPSARARGVVGELMIAGLLQPSSAGSEVERNCGALGGPCTASTGAGGGLLGALGYEVAVREHLHVGGDVLFGIMADNGSRTATLPDGSVRSYAIERAGGMGALRLRASLENDWARGTLAVGIGAAKRAVGIGRKFPSLPDGLSSYASIAFTADASVGGRITASTTLKVGCNFWLENAGDGVVSSGDSFHMVSGPQSFVMPYLALEWGP